MEEDSGNTMRFHFEGANLELKNDDFSNEKSSELLKEALVEYGKIENLIFTIRGQQVMIDRDLAMLYGVETKHLNRQVKRNIERFPEDFMFQLTKNEMENLKCQFGTSSWGGKRKQSYAFTENGIAMLSGVLHSETSIEVNIKIMRAFTAMRHFLVNNTIMFKRLEILEFNQLEMSKVQTQLQQHQNAADHRIDEVFRRLDEGVVQAQQGVFFDGQIFDAYLFVSDLIKKAISSIILIDNYIDETVLTLLDKRINGVTATIYTQQIKPQLQLDIDKHNAQYPSIAVEIFKQSHDRFLIIDDEVYHIGASIKDLGKKWFGFTLMRDMKSSELIKRINGEI